MKVEGIPNTVNHNHDVVIRLYVDDSTAEHLKDLTKIAGAAIVIAAFLRVLSK